MKFHIIIHQNLTILVTTQLGIIGIIQTAKGGLAEMEIWGGCILDENIDYRAFQGTFNLLGDNVREFFYTFGLFQGKYHRDT